MVVYGFLSYHNGVLRVQNHELMEKYQEVLHRDSFGEVREILLVGISYDEDKHHRCRIEHYE